MGLYGKYILPTVINTICSMPSITSQRQKVVPFAKGRVLEIGMGSGLNLPYYDSSKVEFVLGLELCTKMRTLAKKRAKNLKLDVKFIDQACEDIPLESKSADTVLITYTLCTIPQAVKALNEVRGILKTGGELIFCEHGRAPDKHVQAWQNNVNPIWKRIGGGCHLNRPIPEIIIEGGFKINVLNSKYINTIKSLSYNHWGWATKR